MPIQRFWTTVAVAALASLLPAQDKPSPTGAVPVDAAARSAAPAVMPLIGVVDLAKAFDLYPKAIQQKGDLQRMADRFNEQIAQITRRIEELKLQIPQMKEGRDREVKQLELELAMQQRSGMSKLLKQQLAIEDMRIEAALYEDMEVAIAKVAKDRGVHLVLRMHGPAPRPPADATEPPTELQQRLVLFERRQVWFAAPEVDLTPALIQLLQVPVTKDAAPAAAPAGKDPAKTGSDKTGSDKTGSDKAGSDKTGRGGD